MYLLEEDERQRGNDFESVAFAALNCTGMKRTVSAKKELKRKGYLD